jgi:hypothetical protein
VKLGVFKYKIQEEKVLPDEAQRTRLNIFLCCRDVVVMSGKHRKQSDLKQCILLFLFVGIGLGTLAALVIPFWLLVRKVFPSVEYFHGLLSIVLMTLFLMWHEWGNDQRRWDSPWLKMFMFDLAYFVMIFIYYIVRVK